MKILDGDYARFNIAENEKYKLFLTREYEGETQVLHLYRVFAVAFEVFVLANDEDAAKGQASCHSNWPGEAFVVRVPLMIRGWSGNTF